MFLILMREKRDGRLGQFCLSGLFRSSGLSSLFRLSGLSCLSGLSRLFGLSGYSFKILDETRDDSARLVACLARIIHDGSSRSGGMAREDRLASLVYLVCLVCLVEPDRPDQPSLVALFPPVSPVSLESGIGEYSRSAHEQCGLGCASMAARIAWVRLSPCIRIPASRLQAAPVWLRLRYGSQSSSLSTRLRPAGLSAEAHSPTFSATNVSTVTV